MNCWQRKAQPNVCRGRRRTRSRAVRDALEPCVLRGTSTVLRGPGSSDVLPATRLGCNGPKAEAIKQHLQAFVQEELKLDRSEEKTLRTNARKEAAKFLGYEVVVHQENRKRYISPGSAPKKHPWDDWTADTQRRA
jgi:hypothetical protein